jgi:hypothetical protein
MQAAKLPSLALLTSVLLALLVATMPTQAQSNIGLTQYPAPKCAMPPDVDAAAKPEAPNPANRSGNATEVFLYNANIRVYNSAMRAHNDGVKSYARCVEGYIAAGEADIQRIESAIDALVSVANRRTLVPTIVPPRAPSNVAMTQYPAAQCDMPLPVDPAAKPATPSITLNVEQAALFNAKVRAYDSVLRAYNDGVKTYTGCVQDYIATGKADIQRIQLALDTIVSAANGQ